MAKEQQLPQPVSQRHQELIDLLETTNQFEQEIAAFTEFLIQRPDQEALKAFERVVAVWLEWMNQTRKLRFEAPESPAKR